MNAVAPRRLLAIVPDALEGSEPVDEIRRRRDGGEVELRLVVPAVEATPLRHTLGDVDEPRREAHERLRASLELLRRSGLEASGEVGDPDPVQAAQDALLEAPADEVLIFEHAGEQARWFESGLLEKAQEAIEPPLRMVVVESGAGGDHVVRVERTGSGTTLGDEGEADIPISHNVPRVAPGDLAGMVMGIVGTIAVVVLAAAGPGPESGWGAASILIAIAISLINMAHVVGLTLFESVRYRGGFEKFFRGLALVATPAAVLANLLILLFA
jgi:hypothetical protein